MRTALLIALTLTLPAADLLAQGDGRGRGGRDNSVELEHFTFQRIEFPAPSLESVWGEAGVYLPASYDEPENADKRYPWAIWLHGMNGSYRRFHTGAAPVLDELRGDGAIPEMIVVALSAGRRSVYFNGEQSGDYEDLVLHDLFDHIEEKYRVSKQRQHRAIMGISIGGFGAMRFALKYPDRFGAVAAHSSAVPPADPAELSERYARMASMMGLSDVLGDPIDPEIWAKEIPAAMVTRIEPEDLHGLRIYFDVGSKDRYQFAGPNTELHESMKKAGIEHTFRLLDGGGHSWGSGFPREALEVSFVFVGDSMQRDAEAPGVDK